MPRSLSQAQLESPVDEIEQALASRDPKELLGLPQMTDQHMVALAALIGDLLPALFFTDEKAWWFLSCHLALLSIEHGNCPASVFGYVGVGIILGFGRGQYERGFRFGELARALSEEKYLRRVPRAGPLRAGGNARALGASTRRCA